MVGVNFACTQISAFDVSLAKPASGAAGGFGVRPLCSLCWSPLLSTARADRPVDHDGNRRHAALAEPRARAVGTDRRRVRFWFVIFVVLFCIFAHIRATTPTWATQRLASSGLCARMVAGISLPRMSVNLASRAVSMRRCLLIAGSKKTHCSHRVALGLYDQDRHVAPRVCRGCSSRTRRRGRSASRFDQGAECARSRRARRDDCRGRRGQV